MTTTEPAADGSPLRPTLTMVTCADRGALKRRARLHDGMPVASHAIHLTTNSHRRRLETKETLLVS
jgi:hypothetical protein